MIRHSVLALPLLSIAGCDDDKVSTQMECRSPTDRTSDGYLCGNRATAVAPVPVSTTSSSNTASSTPWNCNTSSSKTSNRTTSSLHYFDLKHVQITNPGLYHR